MMKNLQNSIKFRIFDTQRNATQRNATQRNATVSLYLILDTLHIFDDIRIPCGRNF